MHRSDRCAFVFEIHTVQIHYVHEIVGLKTHPRESDRGRAHNAVHPLYNSDHPLPILETERHPGLSDRQLRERAQNFLAKFVLHARHYTDDDD